MTSEKSVDGHAFRVAQALTANHYEGNDDMPKHIPTDKFDETITRGDARSALRDALAKQTATAYDLDVEEIAILPDFNPRITGTKDYDAAIADLTSSILANGFMPGKPLTVYPAEEVAEDGSKVTVFYIVDGHRRFEAIKQANEKGAGIKTVPVSVVPKSDAADPRADLTIMTVLSNNSTRPLSPVELGIVVNRLLGFEVPKAEIARRLNITPRYVDDLLLLHGAPASVQEAVRAGKMSATLAVTTLRQHGDKAAEVVTETVKQAEAAGKAKVTAKSMPKAAPKPKAEAKKAAKEKIAKAAKGAKKPVGKAPAKEALNAGPATDADFYRGAIEHALSMPKKGGAGIDWLARFMANDAVAIGELESWLGQPKGAFMDAALRVPVDREEM